jgi:thioesterase domain-containing protein
MIGGYCGDGWIAYELGRQLREQGEQVDLYACVDLWAPNTKLTFSIRIKMRERWLRVVGWLPERRGLLDLRRRALFVREIGRDWAEVAKWWGLGLTGGWLQRPLTKQGKLMFMMGSPLTLRYRPPATDFDVTLVRGAPFGGYDWAVRREPRDMSWGRMTSGRVDVVEVSGDHISMLEGEKGAELGEALARLATATVARTAAPAVAADVRTPEPSVATG